MKRSLLYVSAVFMLTSCLPPTTPTIDTEPDTVPDTTPLVINSITAEPASLYEKHPVNLIVEASDMESDVVLTYDFDFDGLFNESNGYSYSTPGEKTVAVKASSEGGSATSDYVFTVSEVRLDLSITLLETYAINATGDFSISYRVNNLGNVPIQLTERVYSIWGISNVLLINETNYLPLGEFIITNPALNVYASIVGRSPTDIPNYFYLWIYYDDGYGNGSFQTVNRAFTMY